MDATQPIVCALQMCSGPDLAQNLAQARGLLEDASRGKAVLSVLPENFAFMGAKEADKLALAERDGDGPIQAFLGEQARRLGMWIVGGTLPMAIDGGNRVHAASVLYAPDGKAVARYDKMHLFDVEVPRGDALSGADQYRESATIAPGAEHFVVADTAAGRVGLSVCYDLRFPELYRQLARPVREMSAEILTVPSAFTWRTGEAHWEPLLRARAIENQCFVVAPNQHGTHAGGRRTWGRSMIIDPWGAVLSRLDDGIGLVTARLKRDQLFGLRRTFPVLSHRRIEA